jgi:hypothetical protein
MGLFAEAKGKRNKLQHHNKKGVNAKNQNKGSFLTADSTHYDKPNNVI